MRLMNFAATSRPRTDVREVFGYAVRLSRSTEPLSATQR